MMRKHLAEAVVPVLVELKRIMEAAAHPLLGDLMAAMAAMLRDHKHEVRALYPGRRWGCQVGWKG